MNKFIIIVEVYDRENSQAYPMGGVFDTEENALDYLHKHVDEVLQDHWTKGREDGIDDYYEEFTPMGFEAQDYSDGAYLGIDIHCVPVM